MTPVAILLCAGEGTRMKDERTHKVCFEIAGVPAVVRQISNLKKAGIKRFVVVVGSKADKVMSCLDGIEGIVYAFQPVRNGTGGAALYGLYALKSIGYEGPVLIAMGDKIISPDVFTKLIDEYKSSKKKAAFVGQPKSYNLSGGRILSIKNEFYGIIEQADSYYLALGKEPNKSKEAFDKILTKLGMNEKKKEILIEKALKSNKLKPNIIINGIDFDTQKIENMEYVNTATYIFDLSIAIEKLEKAKQDNAQNEIYLTDAINMLAIDNEVHVTYVNESNKIHTYSTMDELLLLQQFFIEPTLKKEIPRASKWVLELKKWSSKTKAEFVKIYGDDDVIEERRDTYLNLLRSFITKYGDREVVITRAPGRVNLMGRHIEHRGGSINVMSINRETIAIASPRNDDVVSISNTDPKFKDYSFSILDIIKLCDTENWIQFIENEEILKMVVDSKGEWVNYVKAAILRLQLQYKDKMISGMDMMFEGNIPIAAGLSSSSSIVVATAEAAISLNDMDIQPKDFIHLCGEGEWFVGSRGGAGDHAAMKCGHFGKITHLKFFPFEIGESIDFPEEYSLVVANSFVEAKKSAGAKDLFNQKIAEYEFGLMLIKKLFPQYASKIKYLRDVNARNLNIPQSKIYEILLALPEKLSNEDLYNSLPEFLDKIKNIQKSHSIPSEYEIRSTVLYGLAECERAELCIDLLKEKKHKELGKLMHISHDGDRVWKDGKEYDYYAKDEYLYSLIADLRSENITRVERAQVYNQPGGYACSTKTIDELVDYVNKKNGVIGTELSGAGLGGCILILVKKEDTDNLLSSLKADYYDKNNFPMGAEVFKPVAGSNTFVSID